MYSDSLRFYSSGSQLVGPKKAEVLSKQNNIPSNCIAFMQSSTNTTSDRQTFYECWSIIKLYFMSNYWNACSILMKKTIYTNA